MTPVGGAAIIGIGQSEFGRRLPQTDWQLALSAISAAVTDAGIDPREIDGICSFTAPFENVPIPAIVRALDLPELTFFAECPLGGEALGAALGHAVAAIETGRASIVLIYRSLSQSSNGRFGRTDAGIAGDDDVDVVAPESQNLSLAWPHGVMSPGHQFAMTATRYMYDHALTFEQLTDALCEVALAQRRYAAANPNAIMRDRPLTRDDYFEGRMISWPLRLYDYCLENDGAVALVIAASTRSRGASPPVRILATSQSLTPYQEPLGFYQRDLGSPFPAAVAERLYGQAGVAPGRVRVAELYDACTLMPLRSLEAYGLAKEGWRHVQEAGIGPDSPLPVNTHGGHLSEGYVHGMNAVTEAVRQLRGQAATQIARADVALVAAPSGSAAILAV